MIRSGCVPPAGVTCNDLPNTQMSKVRKSRVDQLRHEMVKQRRGRRERRGCFTITSIMSAASTECGSKVLDSFGSSKAARPAPVLSKSM